MSSDRERTVANALEAACCNDEHVLVERRRQHRGVGQGYDIMVIGEDTPYNLLVEHKSLKTSSTNRMYWSQHFSNRSETEHPDMATMDRLQIGRLLQKAYRASAMAVVWVDVRRGRGNEVRHYAVPAIDIAIDTLRWDCGDCNGPASWSIEDIMDRFDPLVTGDDTLVHKDGRSIRSIWSTLYDQHMAVRDRRGDEVLTRCCDRQSLRYQYSPWPEPPDTFLNQ